MCNNTRRPGVEKAALVRRKLCIAQPNLGRAQLAALKRNQRSEKDTLVASRGKETTENYGGFKILNSEVQSLPKNLRAALALNQTALAANKAPIHLWQETRKPFCVTHEISFQHQAVPKTQPTKKDGYTTQTSEPCRRTPCPKSFLVGRAFESVCLSCPHERR